MRIITVFLFVLFFFLPCVVCLTVNFIVADATVIALSSESEFPNENALIERHFFFCQQNSHQIETKSNNNQTTQTSHSHYYNVHCLWVCFILYISLFKFESKGVYLRDKNGFLFVGINEISSAAAWLRVCSQRPPYGSLSSMLMLCVCFVCFWLWRGTLKKEANSMQRENKRQTFRRYEFRICGQCFNRFDWFAMFVPFSLSLSIYLRPLTTFARNVKTEINRSST